MIIIRLTLISKETSKNSPSLTTVDLILFDSFTKEVPLNHTISGGGFDLHLNFIVIREPSPLGTILGLSINVGG